jgi:hypothetical protein
MMIAPVGGHPTHAALSMVDTTNSDRAPASPMRGATPITRSAVSLRLLVVGNSGIDEGSKILQLAPPRSHIPTD